VTNPRALAIISDEPTLRDLLVDIVSAEGIRVSSFSYESWLTSDTSMPQWSWILVDPQRSPAHTDWSLIDAIRQDRAFRHATVVIFTAIDTMTERPDLADTVAMLPKPFDLADLLRLLNGTNGCDRSRLDGTPSA
jgi:CheY-like chemotaxis protein